MGNLREDGKRELCSMRKSLKQSVLSTPGVWFCAEAGHCQFGIKGNHGVEIYLYGATLGRSRSATSSAGEKLDTWCLAESASQI